MKVPFRQGVVKHPTGFLATSGSAVTLNLASGLFAVTIAHGGSNYLCTERSTVNNAWAGPFAGLDYWLYYDVDLVTGVRTFGHTLLDPVTALTAPTSPSVDQHWFDTSTTTMKVWNGARWNERARVFVAKYNDGNSFVSMGPSPAPNFVGTQVGLASTVSAGALIFDVNGSVIKRGDGKFFTTEDAFVTGVPTGAANKLASIIKEAEATQSLGAYSIVTFSAFNKIVAANAATPDTSVFGIIEESAGVGQMVNVILEGFVTNSSWDWTSVGVNAQLYVDNSGAIVTTPVAADALPIGVVVDQTTILLRSAHLTLESGPAAIDDASATVKGKTKLSVAPVSAVDPIAVGDNDSRIVAVAGKVAKAGDTMTGLLVLSGAPSTDLHAATKLYVDTGLGTKSDTTHDHDLAYEPINANIQTHVTDVTTNPHNVTAAQTGAYTSGAVDTLLLGKSDTSHDHTGVYQPLDTDLTNIAALTGSNGFLKTDGANVWSVDTATYSVSTHDHDLAYEPINANIQSHIGSTSNPHGVDETDILPAQATNGGKFLTTNGTLSSWAQVPYDVSEYTPSILTTDGQVVLRFVAPRAFSLLAGDDATNPPRATSVIASARRASFDIVKNGVTSIGSFNFAPAAFVANFTSVPETTTITTVADVGGSLNNTYFTLNSPTPTAYYVWYNVSGGGVDPAPGGTGIPVAITTGDNATAVALATANAVKVYNGPSYVFNAYSAADMLVISNEAVGVTTDATAGTSGFTIVYITQGSSGVSTLPVTAIVAGDVLTVTGPWPADGGIQDLSITLSGLLS